MKSIVSTIILREKMADGSNLDTFVCVDDEGGGPYLAIKQPDMADFVSSEVPEVRIEFKHIEEIYQAMKVLKANWEIAGEVD
jgi:hypothetical protein